MRQRFTEQHTGQQAAHAAAEPATALLDDDGRLLLRIRLLWRIRPLLAASEALGFLRI